jgi:hypothetical protein
MISPRFSADEVMAMAQGAGTLFRTVMASLLMLAALVLFGAPSKAHAHGNGHHATHTVAATSTAAMATDDTRIASVFSLEKPGTAIMTASATHDGQAGEDCGDHGDKTPASGCCFGAACPMTHGGVTPVSVLPMPPPDTSQVSMPSSLLIEGIGTLPALKPPRASV